MIKIIPFTLATIMLLTLAACGGSNTLRNNNAAPTPSSPAESTEKAAAENETLSGLPSKNTENSGTNILVVYFSMPETTDPNNMTRDEDNSVVVIDGEVLGNTQYIAYVIQENTGGDIFRIEPKTPYPTNHSTLLDVADKEKAENARPELIANVENIEQYDVIFLGYPNWWADMPMILYSFLESVDLSGKIIIPFNTHGGSGFSNTINSIARLQTNATVEKDGFTVSRNNADSAEGDVVAWLTELGYYNTGNNNSETPVRITLTVGDAVVTAELDNSETARQFAALLPQTITMSRGRDREYYGRIDGTLAYDEGDVQTSAKDGDLAYWFSGNSLAFFFNTENDSAVNSGIVVFGKITSDLSVFDNMSSNETVTVTLFEGGN